MKRTKGRELPGTFNPMVVTDLFSEQSALWEGIARSHIDRVWKAVEDFLHRKAAHVADTTTARALFQMIFELTLKHLSGTLDEKTTELLMLH